MNKEEIKKAIKIVFYETCKKCYFPKRKCTSCVRDNRKKIKKYIQNLGQKEKILDKVTEYCKRFEYETEPIGDDDYLTERALVCEEILNIIEGEKE